MATVTHKVVKGDTLSELAAKYNTTVKSIAKLNDIDNVNLIYRGQILTISGSSSSTKKASTTNSNKVTIKAFGIQSNSDRTLFVTWNWSKSNTENYKVEWYYHTGDGVWFVGSDSTVTVKQSIYNAPANAKKVRVRIKPISKKKTVNNKETSYWTAQWSSYKTYDFSTAPPVAPGGAPDVKISDTNVLTARLDGLTSVNATHIQFQVVANDSSVFKTGSAVIVTNSATYTVTVKAGSKYKVRCRSYKGNNYSNWTDYSSNVSATPTAVESILQCKAKSETSVYLAWSAVSVAESYEIEYTDDKSLFDVTSVSKESNITTTNRVIQNLESGKEYFFRIRAVNGDNRYSEWSKISSCNIGKKPAPPTTWSSTTNGIVGEPISLYWLHNAEDGSDQTYAELRLYVDDVLQSPDISLPVVTSDDEDENPINVYELSTSKYTEGAVIRWCIKTAGITKEYSNWSTERTITLHAQPTLELGLTDSNGTLIDILEEFPLFVTGLAGPSSQRPIGYHVSVKSNSIYETVDNVGNKRIVNKDEEVYSTFFDTSDQLLLELSPSNIDLENNITYTVTVTVSMDSGLSTEASLDFTVSWTDMQYEPSAEVFIDKDTLSASIRAYCEEYSIVYYKVVSASGVYTVTTEVLEELEGTSVDDAFTTTGEIVYSGTTSSGEKVLFCMIESEEGQLVEDVSLSVYRREYDGSFTELETGLDNTTSTYITDPHPALDYARYRVVAVTNSTGAVSYSDIPAFPVGEKAAIIQWDEEWSYFETNTEDELEQPPWSGSMLKLPYNVDVSDNHDPEVETVKYIGRKHPVSYYGTQQGVTSSWSMEIEKDDEETLYALRRLATWLGDVYVREPSGSGYWASIKVSFSQKHCELTIPVTLDITRVEGGV